MKLSKILDLPHGAKVREYSKALREDFTATRWGLKFDDGVKYSRSELRLIDACAPSDDELRSIHSVKRIFDGVIESALGPNDFDDLKDVQKALRG